MIEMFSKIFSVIKMSSPRVIFVGDSGVGKTSLIHRSKYHNFLPTTTPTIGAGITPIELTSDGIIYEFELWDTAGQEIYRNIVPIYFKGAICAIVVFSVTEPNSFQSVNLWINQIKLHSDEDVGIILVGNKIDSENANINVQEDATKWAKEQGLQIIFTSASTGENVDVLIDHVLHNFIIPYKQPKEIENTVNPSTNQTSKKCCG